MPVPTYKKSADYIAAPPGGSDKTSGAQLATVNGTIGYAADTAELELPGASIGGADAVDYHELNTP